MGPLRTSALFNHRKDTGTGTWEAILSLTILSFLVVFVFNVLPTLTRAQESAQETWKKVQGELNAAAL